jgi:hypothetical protein
MPSCGVRTVRSAARAADHRRVAFAPPLVDRTQQQCPDRKPDRRKQERRAWPDLGRPEPAEGVDDQPAAFVAVATFEMPMYRPAEAFGMMSVMSAQSTARKLPPPTPTRTAPSTKTGGVGASAAIVMPSAPMAVAA